MAQFSPMDLIRPLKGIMVSHGRLGLSHAAFLGAATPFCWQQANQVSALIWVSVLSSEEPPGTQLLSHHPIHLQL